MLLCYGCTTDKKTWNYELSYKIKFMDEAPGNSIKEENEKPVLWNHSFTVPNTGSMKPEFQGGETAIIIPDSFETVKEGDIVAFESPRNNSRPVMHRVIIKGDNYLRTKGDSNGKAEEFAVEKDEYRGKVMKLKDYMKGSTYEKTLE